MHKFIQIAAPAGQPVTLARAKEQLRELAEDQDNFITEQLIPAAVRECEEYMLRSLVLRTYELVLDHFPACKPIWLPRPPVLEVDSIKYIDTDGVEQTMAASDYQVDTYDEPGAVYPASGTYWPSVKCGVVNAVKIRFKAGYSLLTSSPVDYAENIPADIIKAILLTIADSYMWRENAVQGTIITKIPRTAQDLMNPYRVRLQ